MMLGLQEFRGGIHSQRGAAAIEFALIFIPMFALFYALASYGLIMALMQGMTLAAEEGARAAVAVDRTAFASDADYTAGVVPVVRTQVGRSLSWLPDTLKARVLGENNALVDVQLGSDSVLAVTVRYPNYAAAPLIPVLSLPGIGSVPRVGEHLEARANIRL